MSKSPLNVTDSPCAPELIAQVQTALEADGLVLLPTETVYGVAARADRPAALEALARAKRRPPEAPFTWHIGRADCIDELGVAPPFIRRLVERYWPGPLTLVLPDASNYLPHISSGGRVGVRYTTHKGTASILEALPFPVVMTSANLHGEAPAAPGSLAPSLADALTLQLADGPPRIGEASTVLQTGRAQGEERWHFDILRKGLHDIAALRKAAGLRLLFVCTGNTCRSPLAEGLARRALANKLECEQSAIPDFGFDTSSAGIFAYSGGPISSHSLAQLERRGVDLSGHRATIATAALLTDADRIYCLSKGHLVGVHDLLPEERAHTATLLDPDGADVPDPIGGSRADYARCAEHIEALVNARLSEWL